MWEWQELAGIEQYTDHGELIVDHIFFSLLLIRTTCMKQ
jgi:hypothetical protein